MQSSEFSRPQRMDDGRYAAYCIYGGAVVDPTRDGVLKQIAAADKTEWIDFVSLNSTWSRT